jgi:hypothetical protein
MIFLYEKLYVLKKNNSIRNWKRLHKKINKFYRKTGRALLRNQCCCDYGEIDYENSVGKKNNTKIKLNITNFKKQSI